MGASSLDQARIFYLSFACGALGAVIFDAFRAFRRRVRGGTAAVAIQDLLFWAILAAVVFALIYHINNGEPRWYIFAGLILGAALYLSTVSKFVVKIFEKVLAVLGTAAKFLWKALVFPFKLLKKPLCILAIPLSKLRRFIARLFRKKVTDAKKIKKVLKMY